MADLRGRILPREDESVEVVAVKEELTQLPSPWKWHAHPRKDAGRFEVAGGPRANAEVAGSGRKVEQPR
jgi:hypothetical protein